METLLFLFTGLVLGAIFAWFVARYKFASESRNLSKEELQQRYVLKEVFEGLQTQCDILKDDLKEKEQELRTISSQLSASEQANQHLHQKLSEQKEELNEIQRKFQTEFENIANRLLEEKTEKFTRQNKQQLDDILSPLREKIKDFEHGIDKKFHQETIDRISLKKEIEQLRDLNLQLSQDAVNLTNALKGDSKSQGDWGEFQLEMLLEKAGLLKEVHYRTQAQFKDDSGKDKRPDFIIQLPEEKHIIIDSKVSLTAYEKFFNENDETKRKKHLKDHILSLKNHIKDLSGKKYQSLYQINSPDYLLLFVPLEPAFSLAVQNDHQIFVEALEKNIVIVCPSTLLATMRTVAYIWKQDKQKRNVLEIARQSGLLYDKFCNFVEDLQAIGARLESAQTSYHDAMNKLTESKKKGDTLVGRAEKIRQLGAKASRSLPKEMLELAGENSDDGL